MLVSRFFCMVGEYTVGSRKRAHGRCTLRWAQTGGWADIRLVDHCTLMRKSALYFLERHIMQNNWQAALLQRSIVPGKRVQKYCASSQVYRPARNPRPCMWTLEAAHPRTFQYFLANCNIYVLSSHIFWRQNCLSWFCAFPVKRVQGGRSFKLL